MLDQNIIKASEFKAKCLKLMDEVSESGKELVITKNHKPIAILTPYIKKPKTLYGIYKDRMQVSGDIMSPVDEEWDAMTNKGWDNLS